MEGSRLCPSPAEQEERNYEISTRKTQRGKPTMDKRKENPESLLEERIESLEEYIQMKMKSFKKELINSICSRMKKEMEVLGWIDLPESL